MNQVLSCTWTRQSSVGPSCWHVKYWCDWCTKFPSCANRMLAILSGTWFCSSTVGLPLEPGFSSILKLPNKTYSVNDVLNGWLTEWWLVPMSTSMPVTRLGKHGPAASWPQRINSDNSFAVHQWQLVYHWSLPIGNGNFAASWGSVAFASTSLWWLAWCMELMFVFLVQLVLFTRCNNLLHEGLAWVLSEYAEFFTGLAQNKQNKRNKRNKQNKQNKQNKYK